MIKIPEKKRKNLIQIFNKEKFHLVLGEIVKQLVNDENEESQAVIANAIADEDARVRRSVIENVKTIPASLLADYEKLLSDQSYNTVEMALEKLSKQFPENIEKYLDITKNDFGVGNKVRVKWLETGCRVDKMLFLPELITLTGPGFEFRTRTHAFEALKRLNYLDKQVIENGFNALLHFNGRLSNPVSKVMRYFKEQTAHEEQITKAFKAGDWSDWEGKRLKAKLKMGN